MPEILNETTRVRRKEALIEKWTEKGFLNPVNESKPVARYSMLSEKRKLMVAALLENTEKVIKEATTTSDVATFIPVLIPVLRRVIPGLIAFDLCGTQPLSQPSGMVFAITPTYSGTMNREFEVNDSQILKLASAITGLTVGSTVAQGSVDGSTVATTARGTVEHINSDGTALIVKLDNKAAPFVATLGIYGGVKIVDPSSEWDAASTSSVSGVFANIAMWNVLIDNFGGPYATSTAEYLGRDIQEMSFKIASQTVAVKEHKLKARYSLEMETDLRNVHGLDANDEMEAFLSAQISTEINAVILNKMKQLAISGGMITWDYDAVAATDARWEWERYRNLVSKIEAMANQIFKATRRGKANFIVASPNVASILSILSRGLFDAANKMPADVSSDYDPNNGYAGMFNGMKVFVDPWNEEDYIMLGYKGTSEFDAGLFFCPYVALQAVKTTEQETGNPVIIMQSRYGYIANPFGGENYFRYISVQNIPFYA